MDKRAKAWDLVAGLMQAQNADDPAVTEYRVDPRCHICAAPDRGVPNGVAIRNFIDELLMVPKGYASILKLIEPLMESWPEDARVSRYSLMRHAKNHLRWEQAAARRIAERHAQRAGKRDEASERMLTTEVVLETVQQRGYEAVVSGEVTPSVRDTLAANAALREIEKETEGAYTTAELLSQLDKIIQIMREIVPPEYHPAIFARLEAADRATRQLPGADPAWEEIVIELGQDAMK
jgi:hypothetical protein